MKKANSTLIYVLSSISILCCCFAGLGIFLALPSFIIANKNLKEAEANHHEYEAEELKALGNAKTFALVALGINALTLAYFIYSIATTDWNILMEEFQRGYDEYKVNI